MMLMTVVVAAAVYDQYHLCRGLGVSTRQSRLHQDLALFHHVDLAICREGVESLSLAEMQQVDSHNYCQSNSVTNDLTSPQPCSNVRMCENMMEVCNILQLH